MSMTMKRWLILLLLSLLGGARAQATFTLVQAKTNNSCSTVSCAVTVTATGTGNLIVAGFAGTANETITSMSGGGTWTLCGVNCQKGDATSGWVDMAYTLSSTSGATSLTFNFSAGAGNRVAMIWEYSFTTGPVSLDTSNSVNDAVNCTSCAGVGLTIGGSNDVISTLASCGGTCSGITTYAADPAAPWPGGDGMAHLLNTTSGTAPNWTQSPTSHLTTAAIAIKEAGGGGGGTPAINKTRKLEQLDGEGGRR